MKKALLWIFLFLGCFFGHAQQAPENRDSRPLHIAPPSVKVFPNPAQNVVNILGLQDSQKADITVTDAQGNTVLHYQWAIRKRSINLPVAQLHPGMYVVSVQSPEQRTKVKFYKQ